MMWSSVHCILRIEALSGPLITIHLYPVMPLMVMIRLEKNAKSADESMMNDQGQKGQAGNIEYKQHWTIRVIMYPVTKDALVSVINPAPIV